MIIRVISSVGISRASLPADATLGDLRAEIRNRIQIPDGTDVQFVISDTNVKVYVGFMSHITLQVAGQDNEPLSKFGVEHGTCLRLVPIQTDASSPPDLSYVCIGKADVKEPEAVAAPSAPASAPLPSKTDGR